MDCDTHILVATATAVVTLDINSGEVKSFAPNATLSNAIAIAADPSNGYAFITDVSRNEIWRKDFDGSSRVIYHLPSGDSIRSAVYSRFLEALVAA